MTEVEPDSGVWTWWRKAGAECGRRLWSTAELTRRIESDGRGPIDPSLMRKWMRGMHSPRADVIARVARAFGWPPGYIDDDEMLYPPPHDQAWLSLTLRALDDNGKKVLAALSDPAAAEYLMRALQQFRELEQRMRQHREAR